MAGLLLDSDGGVDDALALVLALSQDAIPPVALTTVHGNVPEPQAATNLKGILGLADARGVAVARGATAPLRRGPVLATTVHGDDGLGGLAASVAPFGADMREADRPAAEVLADHAAAGGAIAAIGPLTNVAAAVRGRPADMARASRIVLMGCGFGRGNVTPYSEFNIFADPHAADVVLGSGVRVAIVPLNLCERVVLRLERLEALDGRAGSPLSRLLLQSHRPYAAFHQRKYGLFRGCHPHDALAVAACAWPHLFAFEPASVTVDTREGDRLGETAVAYGGDGTVEVAVDVDAASFLSTMLSHLERALTRNG